MLRKLLPVIFLFTATAAGPIHNAARDGDMEAVKKILDASPGKAASFDTLGRSAVHYVVQGGYTEIVQLFIERKTDFNIVDRDGKSPLHWAVESNRLEAVKLLLAVKKLKVDLRDKQGRTPLVLAAKEGSEEICKALLDRKADVSE
ncbi:MAG: ankyrin repeat domain-containing protein, partial [Planctomycetota bacterium]|nr:ankyrin repeat domain-containing protein [Planctomycetota bacterium]